MTSFEYKPGYKVKISLNKTPKQKSDYIC